MFNFKSLLIVLLLAAFGAAQKEVYRNGTIYEALEVIGKSPTELLKIRGYQSEVHYVRTVDGYYLHLVRVINPKLPNGPTKRPVLFNHGLIESSTIWLINARDIKEAQDLSGCHKNLKNIYKTNDTLYRNGPMELAAYGYDVWLLSMRGTDFSMRHETMTPLEPEFWDYSMDDFALKDVPGTLKYIMNKTKAKKVGYVGHSQATFAGFTLLSNRPDWANVMEPVVMVAPIAYVHHTTSLARPIVLLIDLLLKGGEASGPFPANAASSRKRMTKFCQGQSMDLFCQMFYVLTSGQGEKWLKGYWNHIPFHTSLKVIRHFAQLGQSMNFQRYDHGPVKNVEIYNQTVPPSNPIESIKSKSLCLIYSNTDNLAKIEDIELFKARLKVPLFKEIKIIGSDFNHFDLLTGYGSDRFVFKPMLEIFEHFERVNGACSKLKNTKTTKLNGEKLKIFKIWN